jgi:ribose transport system ATP-binding protein
MVDQPPAPLLEMRGIVKTFYGTQAVNGVDFSVRRGEVHGLVGENGAGKSTLMKIIAGVHSPDGGKIFFNGNECLFGNYAQARKAGIGIVYQELSLLPELSVGENIVLGVWPRSRFGLISWNEIKRVCRNILKEINVDLDPGILVSSLPMAMRQMVEIAKVLAQQPELIIFDEPTAPLSRDEVSVLFKIFTELKNRGKAIIFISHRLDEVLSVSDRITVMKDGQVVVTDSAAAFDHQLLISSMVGREMSEIFPVKHKMVQSDRDLFTFDGVLQRTKTRVIFSVGEGSVTAVGGLQGQGQLELLQSIFGVGGCEKVTMTIDGKRAIVKNQIQALRHGIAFVPENRTEEGVFLTLSAMENLTAPTIDRRKYLGLIKRKLEESIVQEMVDRLSIRISSFRQTAQSLSGGNMQKLVLGKWLIFSPKVIVLLEPTKGVDIATKQQIYLLVRQLADKGVAVIVNTSDMLELIGWCDRIMVMNHGVFTACLEGEDITEENIMTASVSRKDILTGEEVL